MVQIRLMNVEEAKRTRTPKAPGVRRQRMNEFDGFARSLVDADFEEAVVYENIEEEPQKFVLSLRNAFRRAGLDVTVRKMRGRDEVRAWRNAPKPMLKKRSRSKPKVQERELAAV